ERAARLDRERHPVYRAHHSAVAAANSAFRVEVLAEPRSFENDRHAAPLPAASQHRAVLPRAAINSGGAASRHRSKARGQRGAKEHPSGNAAKSGGWPSIAISRCTVSDIRGIELSRASV